VQTAEKAIQWAEAPQYSEGMGFIFKGKAEGAYKKKLADLCEQKKTEEIFRYLITMKEGKC